MKNKKNTRTNLLAVILIATLILGYRFVIYQPIDQTIDEEKTALAERISAIIESINQTSFDTSVTTDQKFKNLKNIGIPLIEVPIGKTNPFSI